MNASVCVTAVVEPHTFPVNRFTDALVCANPDLGPVTVTPGFGACRGQTLSPSSVPARWCYTMRFGRTRAKTSPPWIGTTTDPSWQLDPMTAWHGSGREKVGFNSSGSPAPMLISHSWQDEVSPGLNWGLGDSMHQRGEGGFRVGTYCLMCHHSKDVLRHKLEDAVRCAVTEFRCLLWNLLEAPVSTHK